MDAPHGYERMDEIVRELSAITPISDVVEYGCGGGWFVKYLMENGFNAYGVDITDKFYEDMEPGRLLNISAQFSPDYLGREKFDLVVANRVLSVDAIQISLAMSQSNKCGTPLGECMRLVESSAVPYAYATAKTMLDASFRQLRPGKLFTSFIDDGEESVLIPEIIEASGYNVVRNTRNETILQKPL